MDMEASRAAPRSLPKPSLRLAPPLRLRRQAEPAFEQLYRRHAREVYQYALALTANPADAEDVTQTTFLNAFRAFQRGERPSKPHNWLIAIAHNVCRMRWRQAGSRPREVALEEAPEPVATDHERPDLDEVLGALARLTFNQRAALVMRELEGRSYEEIGATLGLSMSAVEALLFRARRRLRLQRSALAALSTAPLPGSLSSFLGAGAGGGAVAAGGAAIGANVVLKAAALVAAGAVTAGVGYQSVDAVSAAPSSPPPAQAQATPKAKARLAAPRRHHARAAATAVAHPQASASQGLRQAIPRANPAPSATPTSSAPTTEPATATPPPPAITTTAATTPVATVPLPKPPEPPPVTAPLPPVPPLPLPPVPPLPIPVTTPDLPDLP
jgi:RNA polymerase sigma factor (sigma-70 family)